MVNQLIIGRAKNRVSCIVPKATRINHALFVLNSKPDRKRLGLNIYALFVQRSKGIPRAVPDCQHHKPACQIFTVRKMQAFNLIAVFGCFQIQLFNLGTKANLTAQLNNLRTHFFHHIHQFKGTNMGFTYIFDFRRRARRHKLVQHLAAIMFAVFYLAIQLAVRKGTCAAFTKLHVRLRV